MGGGGQYSEQGEQAGVAAQEIFNFPLRLIYPFSTGTEIPMQTHPLLLHFLSN